MPFDMRLIIASLFWLAAFVASLLPRVAQAETCFRYQVGDVLISIGYGVTAWEACQLLTVPHVTAGLGGRAWLGVRNQGVSGCEFGMLGTYDGSEQPPQEHWYPAAMWSGDTTECGGGGGGACPAGEKKTVNVTMGWARSGTPNAPDTVGPVSMGPGDSIAAGSCVMGRPYEIVDCFRSAEPSINGLYRISCDYEFTQTGAEATQADPKASPATPDQPCAGVVGEVNGRKVCVGTVSNPLPPPVGAQPAGQNSGNPAAGPKPSSGPGAGEGGAGRTPVVGSGGNAGGGSSAAVPPGGNTYGGGAGGTGQVEVTVETCGLPGKPKCRIDETGTPDGSTLSGKLSQITAAGDALKGAVEDVSKPSDLGWSFGIALPEGSCSALQFYRPGGTWGVDICDSWLVNLVRTLLAWAFGAWTAVYVYRRVTAAAGGEKG